MDHQKMQGYAMPYLYEINILVLINIYKIPKYFLVFFFN